MACGQPKRLLWIAATTSGTRRLSALPATAAIASQPRGGRKVQRSVGSGYRRRNVFVLCLQARTPAARTGPSQRSCSRQSARGSDLIKARQEPCRLAMEMEPTRR